MNTIGTDERDLFEVWYCEDAAQQGCALPEGIANLREGDGYGSHRHMLNGKWQGWQAGRASLGAAQVPSLRSVLELAEAALVAISGASREPGVMPVLWCESRAAKVLPAIRAALSQPSQQGTK